MIGSASHIPARLLRWLAGTALLAGLGQASCGARTELWMQRPCGEEGEERTCFDTCGEGSTICEDGFWSECSVPRKERTCRDACGEGVQVCSDGDWGDCRVADAQRACSNQCGTGVENCSSGRWGSCQVPPATFGCADACGAGLQRCENGELGVCEVPITLRDCSSVCGPGHEACREGAWQPCDAPRPLPPRLQAVVRDFSVNHPDFEIMSPGAQNRLDLEIVEDVLGPDDTPVYRGNPATGVTISTTGAANFSEWYHDVPGVNVSAELPLQLESSASNPLLFVFADTSFFPIDDQLLGNENFPHNFHFTLEAVTSFQYVGGEVFRFTGDDDMWVFINRRLAIDLGGLHQPRSATVELDQIAASHGLTLGQVYPLHFFFAERHTSASNFTIETSIAEAGSCQ